MSLSSLEFISTGGRAPILLDVARHCDGIRIDVLPQDVVQIAKQTLLDYVGVSVAGCREPLAELLYDEMLQEASLPEASVFGQSRRLSRRAAALVNGAIAHAIDYDDWNDISQAHPSCSLWASTLATAEALNSTGAETLGAFVAGYEAQARIGSLFGRGHYEQGFHGTGTIGTFGPALAASRLLGSDTARSAAALAIAATSASGLKVMFGTMCKPLHAGRAAQNGVAAAMLAARGFTTRLDAIEGIQGFASAESTVFRPEYVDLPPPNGFHLRDNLFKHHASCFDTHPVIECIARLRRDHAFRVGDVAKVVIIVDRHADGMCNILNPATGLECKFSLRMTCAMALAEVNTSDPDMFSDATANNSALTRLRDLVMVDCTRDLDQMYAKVTIVLSSGAEIEAEFDSKSPNTDIDAQGAGLARKFRALLRRQEGGLVDELEQIISDFDQSGPAKLMRSLQRVV